jgi:3-keto-5-aminohexanoate cleavage enzyme
MVHLHVRDARGNLTDSPDIFRRTLDLVRRKSDIVIQGSTGGTPKGGIGALSHEERAGGLLDERVEVGSLNMGSVNMGDDPYVNSGSEIRAWAALMQEKGIRPELEIFEAGMLETVRKMAAEGLLVPPFVCGVVAGLSLPATPEVLCFLKSLLPADALWGVIHHHMPNFRAEHHGPGDGGHLRAGGVRRRDSLRPRAHSQDQCGAGPKSRGGDPGAGLRDRHPR